MGLKFFNSFNAMNATNLPPSRTEKCNRLCEVFDKHKMDLDAALYIESLAVARILHRDEICLIQTAKTNGGKFYELATLLSQKPMKVIQQLKRIASEMGHTEFERDLSAQGF